MTEIPTETLVTVFGGSGFLGRHVVRALAREGYRVRPAVRRPDLAGHLQPLGRVGQIHAVQANVRYPASVEAAVRDADVVINLVGILFERGKQRFEAVQAEGAHHGGARGGRGRRAADPRVGARRRSGLALALRAHQGGGRGGGAGAVPDATIFRPSILFGPEDDFFNRFAAMARHVARAAADRRRRRRNSSRCSSAMSRRRFRRQSAAQPRAARSTSLAGRR